MYKNLKSLRETLQMTQKEFAESLSIGLTTYNGYETGARDPRSDFWIAVAEKYHVTIDYLMGYSNDPHKTSDDAPVGTKKAPPDLPEEALKIAKDYTTLSDHGKGAVKAILSYESGAASLAAPLPVPEQIKEPVVAFPKAKRTRAGMVEIKTYDQPAAAGLGNYLDEPEYHIEQYPDSVIHDKADFGVIISGDSMEPRVHDGGTVFVQAAPSIDPGKIGIFVLNGQAYCKKLMVDHSNRQVRLVSLNPKYSDIVISEADDIRTIGRVLGQWTPGHKQELFGW